MTGSDHSIYMQNWNVRLEKIHLIQFVMKNASKNPIIIDMSLFYYFHVFYYIATQCAYLY